MDVPENMNPEIRASMLPHQLLFLELIKTKKRGDIENRLEDDSEENINSQNEEWYE